MMKTGRIKRGQLSPRHKSTGSLSGNGFCSLTECRNGGPCISNHESSGRREGEGVKAGRRVELNHSLSSPCHSPPHPPPHTTPPPSPPSPPPHRGRSAGSRSQCPRRSLHMLLFLLFSSSLFCLSIICLFMLTTQTC